MGDELKAAPKFVEGQPVRILSGDYLGQPAKIARKSKVGDLWRVRQADGVELIYQEFQIEAIPLDPATPANPGPAPVDADSVAVAPRFVKGQRVHIIVGNFRGQVGEISGPSGPGAWYVITSGGAKISYEEEAFRAFDPQVAASISDMVNHPPHYLGHPSGVECVTITEHFGFCVGNAMKYLWRADAKGNAIEDLRKARWYVDREIERRTKLEAK